MHVKDRVGLRDFNWWYCDLSYFPLFESQVPRNKWVTPVARELGVGASIFLMTMRAFAWLFLWLFIINLPLLIFYQGGGTNPEAQGPKSFQFTDAFGAISLGNMGVSDYACSNVNVARNHKNFTFMCPYGEMRFLGDLGLQRKANQSCYDLFDTYLGEGDYLNDDFNLDCNMQNGLTPYGK